MNDFKSEPEELRNAIKRAVSRVIDSGWYVLGNEVESFEKEWSQICGSQYAIGVGNGMDAIEISLRAHGIGEGDEVITTPMTAFASVLAIIRAGATPVLADIDIATGLLSIKSAERCISKKTKAIMLVHLYGQIRNMSKWVDLCNNYNIELIEDCAQAHLAKSDGRTAGTFGSIAAYSFYPTKNLGGYGDGGMVMTDKSELAIMSRSLRNYGQNERYYHPVLGMNSRLDEIQAAILSEKLKWLPKVTEKRKAIAKLYMNNFSNNKIDMLEGPEDEGSHVYHLFVVISDKRDDLQQHLSDRGIQSLIHYPVPVHNQKPCIRLIRDKEGLGNSEKHASTCLSLPCHPHMTDENVQYVIDAVNSF